MLVVNIDQALGIVRDAVEPIVRLEALSSAELAGRIVAKRTRLGDDILEEGTRLDRTDEASRSGSDGAEVVVYSRPKMVVLASKVQVGPGCDLWIDPGIELLSKLSRCRGMVPLMEEYRPGSGRQVMESNIGADLVVILPRDQIERDEAVRFCSERGNVLFDHISDMNIGTTFAIVGPTPFMVLPSDGLEMVRSALALLYEVAGRLSRYAFAPGDLIKVRMARTVEGHVPLLIVRTEDEMAWPLHEDGPERMLKNMDGFVIPGPDDRLLEGSVVTMRRFRI